MNRKIILVLALIAGAALALILLLPGGDGGGENQVAVGRPTVEKPAKAMKTRTEVLDADVSPAKREATQARAARRATPYFQHVQTVAKRWMRIGNLMAGQGQEDDASKARTVARALRSANRTDGTEEAQKAALDEEGRILAELKARYPEGDVSKILANIELAYNAALEGQAPPQLGKAAGLEEASGGLPAPSTEAPEGEAGAAAP